MDYLFPPTAPSAVPITGEDAFYPIRRIFCVARNYEAHAAEMGAEIERTAPFYFIKSSHDYAASGSLIPYPAGTSDFQYEIELAVFIGSDLHKANAEKARMAILGYAVALDMTRRDLQSTAKAKGFPWDMAKDFENSAVIAPMTRASEFKPEIQRIYLEVNHVIKQDAHLSDMVWKCDEIVAQLSQYYHLGAGDVILTGTPAGVGPVEAGDEIVGCITGLESISLFIGEAE